MAGNNSVRGDETITFTDNMSFDGTERGGKMTTNGQLWIGSTAARHVQLGSLTSPDSSILIGYISPNITLTINGAKIGETITGDTGGPLSPVAGNWNIFGQTAGSVTVFDTIGSGNTLSLEDRTWTTQFVVDPSAVVGLRGTFATITAALAAAVSGQNIFIRPGTYTENLTLKSGVNLFAYHTGASGGVGSSNVIINGKCTATFAGSCTLSGIALQTNSDFALSITGSAATFIYVNNCVVNALNNTSLNASSSTQSLITLTNCQAFGANPLFSISSSSGLRIQNSTIAMTAASASTCANTSALEVRNSQFICSVSSADGSSVDIQNSITSSSNIGITTFAIGGNLGNNVIMSSGIASSTASCVSIAAGCECVVTNCFVNSSNANVFTGAGELKYELIAFTGTSSGHNVTTETPLATLI